MWKKTCIALLILSLTACGGTSTNTSTNSAPTEQQKRVLEKRISAYTPATVKGNENLFDSAEPIDLIVESLKLRDEDRANQVIDKSMVFLGTLRDSVDEKTKKVVSARDLNKESYLTLESFLLGLSIGDLDFEKRLNDIKKELGTKEDYLQTSCHWHRPMLTTYSWVNSQVMHKMFDYPAESTMVAGKVGLAPSHNPFNIINYLKGKISETDFLNGNPATGEFWLGMRNYLDGNKTGANYHFETFLTTATKTSMGFEIAAAAALLNEQTAHEPK